MAGTGLAQVILMAATPILSRLFDPIQFGILTAFLVVPNALLPAIGGKFEVAMVLPKSNGTARRLLGFASQTCVAISLLFMAWILLPGGSSEEYAPLEPIYLLLAGHVLILQYMLNRRSEFKRLGLVKVIVSAVTVTTMLVAGFADAGASGLIFASLLGQAAALAGILYWTAPELRGFVAITSRAARPVLRRNRSFPTLNATSSLLDGITLALPILAFERWCSQAELGQLGMMIRLTAAPTALVAISISQVNLRVVSKLAQSGQSALRHVLVTSGFLWGLAVPSAIVTAIWGPDIFAIVLGEEWRESGRLAAIYAPALAVRFAISPLSSTLGATRHNLLGMVWRLIAFVVTLIVLLVVGPKGNPGDIIVALAMIDVALYLIYFGFILFAAARPVQPPKNRRNRVLPPTA
jgi:O-antigen/teichoic acid export membrane protein